MGRLREAHIVCVGRGRRRRARRREDVFNLGIAFAQMMFPSLVEKGTDLRRLMVDVYGNDMQLMADYCQEDEPVACLVMAERDGAGWAFLRSMLTRESSARALRYSAFLQ